MPASRATSRKLRLAKLRSALNWLNAASTSERRVFSFCCALMPITMSESLPKVLLALYQRMNILDCSSIVNER
ncbi:Uncharacterised protein [Shigella sonnei]|nr:Uncharacterised protein [Shigella sonnei]